MSSLSDAILPTGLVLLGLYALSKLMSGSDGGCTGGSKTCVGPLCWATCQTTGGSTGISSAPSTQQGSDLYGTPYQAYPVGSINIGLPAGPGNVASPTPCGAFDWITRWQECGFSW